MEIPRPLRVCEAGESGHDRGKARKAQQEASEAEGVARDQTADQQAHPHHHRGHAQDLGSPQAARQAHTVRAEGEPVGVRRCGRGLEHERRGLGPRWRDGPQVRTRRASIECGRLAGGHRQGGRDLVVQNPDEGVPDCERVPFLKDRVVDLLIAHVDAVRTPHVQKVEALGDGANRRVAPRAARALHDDIAGWIPSENNEAVLGGNLLLGPALADLESHACLYLWGGIAR